MKQLLIFATLSTLLALPGWASEAVKLPQEFTATIKPGKIHQECVEFKKGQVVAYKFNASQPMPVGNSERQAPSNAKSDGKGAS